MHFAIFPFHLSKVPRLPRKSEARSYEVLNLSCKIIVANLKIWCSKMLPVSGNQPPDLSDEHVSCTARTTRHASLQILCKYPTRLPSFLEMLENPYVLLTFWQGAESLAPATQNHIWMSKSGPNIWCFVPFDLEMCFAPQQHALFQHHNFQRCSDVGVLVHFGLEMCFAPQRRALFQHLDFQEWSETISFLHFSLRNVLRATTVCNFSSLIWRAYFSTLRSHKSLEKHSISRLSYLFAHLHLLSSASFSSLIFFLLLFSHSSHLCFFICPYCRKFDF